MKQALIKHIESLDLYSYTISKFEVEINRFIASIASIEQDYKEDKRIQFSDLPFLDCKLQTKKRNPKRFKSIYDAVKVASSTDEARQALLGFKVEYNALLATDGRRLASFDYAGPLKPGLYDKNHNLSIETGFPDYKKFLPVDFNYRLEITDQLYYSARAAQKFYYIARKPGAYAYTAVQINAENCVLCLNVDYLIDGLNAIYYANNKSFDGVYLEYISDDRPVRLSIPGTQNFYYLMPISLDDPANCEKLNISTFFTVEESITKNNLKPEPVEPVAARGTAK